MSNNEQNHLDHEESYLKDIIYLTLLRQKIDGSVFDADFCAQDRDQHQDHQQFVSSQSSQIIEKSSISGSRNNSRSQQSISGLLEKKLLTAKTINNTTTAATIQSDSLSKTKSRPKANTSQVATIRVHIPELKAEIEIDCQPHDNFWHLKLCLVDNLLNSGQLLAPDRTDGQPTTIDGSIKSRHSGSIVSHLLLSSSRSSNSTSIKRRSSLASRAKNVISRRRPPTLHCHSSGGSLSSTDASTCSTNNASSNSFAQSNSMQRASTGGQAFYYGFSAFNLSPWDDNARHSSDLTEDEAAAVNALELATATSQVISDTEDQDYEDDVHVEFGEDDDDGDDCEGGGDYTTLAIRDHSLSPNDHANSYDYNQMGQQQQQDQQNQNDDHESSGNRLFEQALKSGYLNYGFYSFSLAKYVDDQTHLTEYLSLVSSSSGVSYYLDLEFKLKQRQQTPSASAYYYLAPTLSSNSSTLNVINRPLQAQQSTSHRLSLTAANTNSKTNTTSTATNNNKSAFSFANLSIEQQQAHRPAPLSCQTTSTTTNQSFANNMIAKLSAGGGAPTHPAAAQPPPSSAQSKRKRSKLIDMLLNTNWSKQSQQAGNLMKLNKILLACDANFLDEKTGESPLSLVISSSQINVIQSQLQQQSLSATGGGCPQSTSLFSLQCQSSGMSLLMLQQTNISELIQSKAPLIERLLLLLIKSGALIDFRNSDGRTPLHVAAMKSNFWALKTLLDLGASTDYRDINGLTPLYYSILHKADLKVTQLLLNHNRNPSSGSSGAGVIIDANLATRLQTLGITDQHGWQEVHQACKLGLDAHLEKLLYYGCDMNAKISGSGNTPLHVAAINDQLNCAKVLLMRGADKTITNNSHQTAHQVAVISNNMDLAEFIAEHTDAKVIPFAERPANFNDISAGRSAKSSIRSSVANSHSSASLASQQKQRAIIMSQQQLHQQFHHNQSSHHTMNPLVLDVAQGTQHLLASNSTGGSQPQSLLSISGPNQLNVQVNNISPCLSQRSCATSNTTSSSGVCCDGDGSHSAEELNQHQQAGGRLNNSQSHHSNITIISIGNKVDKGAPCNGDMSRFQVVNNNNQLTDDMDELDENDEDDLRSSASNSSSSNGLYSIMSEERPLFVGTIVEAISEYQSGDPNHLQLHRGDLIEVLEFKPELLQSGQLPRLANKPMLYGRRKSDSLSGLFPSFCVQRTKHKSIKMRQKLPMTDVTNFTTLSDVNSNAQTELTNSQCDPIHNALKELGHNNAITNGKPLSESQSMAVLNNQQQQQALNHNNIVGENQFKMKFRELQVTLNKINEGFGFVLRGAKVDPATLASGNGQSNKVIIDEHLMAANNLVSLQYLDEIELNSVAHQAGLKRGDFLVAVNNQDVRLSSHEQVVHMIRQSGDQVHLKIATPIGGQRSQPNYAMNGSKTMTMVKVKPEPPKRDPNTTLTRNRAQRGKSMVIQSQQQLNHQQQPDMMMFDANKPLPIAPTCSESPMSPTGSLNLMARSYSGNLTHFHSIQSLSCNAPAADTQSISSVSTISANHQQQQSSQQATPTHSSSSTTTLTTVATMKPTAPPKTNSAQLNNATSQLIYQPAVITTTKRNSQHNISPTSPLKVCHPSPATSNQMPQAPVTAPVSSSNTCPAPPPPPPPPPPPLPNFSATPEGDRLRQRRTSAPTNQSTTLLLGSNRLQRKRESLALVSQFQGSANTAPVPAQFGAVAAACAAAANNRIQRQQQQQEQQEHHAQQRQQYHQQQQQQQPKPQEVVANELIKDGSPIVSKLEVSNTPVQAQEALDRLSSNSKEPDSVVFLSKEAIETPTVPIASSCNKQTSRQPMQGVATLGRKSSAQIIQLPKQTQQTQIQQLYPSHSQTLKSKPKRAEISNYDELPPPPPPLPPMMDESVWQLSESQVVADPTKQAEYQNHVHSHHTNHHKHPVEYQPAYQSELATAAPSKRQSHENPQQQHHLLLQQQQQQLQLQQQQQQQKLFLIHQQQMIKQQLRQQQLIQQQQQQLKLQQQMQLQQGICLDGKHGLGFVHGHEHDHNHHHHHHHHNHHNNRASYESTVTRGGGQHYHQHQHSLQAQQLVAVQQQQQQQQLQQQQHRILAAKSHGHAHHHHHHHPQH